MADGPIRDVLGSYRQSVEAGAETHIRVKGRIGLQSAEVRAADGGMVRTLERLDLRLVLRSDISYRAWIYLGITEGTATPVFVLNPGRETSLEPGLTTVSCSIDNLPLPSGRFYVWAAVYQDWTDGPELLGWQPIAQFASATIEYDARQNSRRVLIGLSVTARTDRNMRHRGSGIS